MRRMVVLFLTLLAVNPLLAQSPSAAKRALISELLTLTRGGELAAEVSIQTLRAAQGTLPGSTKEVNALRKEFAASPEHRAAVEAEHLQLYDSQFTEKQLRELVTFLKSETGRRFVDAQLSMAAIGRQGLLAGLQPPPPASQSQRAQTMADIRIIAVASEAYATDHNLYPDATDIPSLEKVLAPIYIRAVPQKDAWGKTFRYIKSKDRVHYRIVSGGPDGKIDPASLKVEGRAQKNDDLIFEDGQFVQPPGG